MTESIIKQIPDFPNYYASRDGKVFKTYKNGKTIELTPITHDNGYQIVNLYNNKTKRQALIHRIIWETFMGDIPQGLEIDHINCVRSDNRLDNLRTLTHQENMNRPERIEAFVKSMLGKINKHSKEYCERKGLDYEEELNKYYDRLKTAQYYN